MYNGKVRVESSGSLGNEISETKVEEGMNSYSGEYKKLEEEFCRDNICNWLDYVYVVLIRGEEMRIRRVEINGR